MIFDIKKYKLQQKLAAKYIGKADNKNTRSSRKMVAIEKVFVNTCYNF